MAASSDAEVALKAKRFRSATALQGDYPRVMTARRVRWIAWLAVIGRYTWRRGPAEQPFDAEVLIDIGPVDAIARSRYSSGITAAGIGGEAADARPTEQRLSGQPPTPSRTSAVLLAPMPHLPAASRIPTAKEQTQSQIAVGFELS